MKRATPPPEVLEAAGLSGTELSLVPWEAPVWLFEESSRRGLLKVLGYRSEGSLRWEMDLLQSLAGRFPVPQPLNLFDGKSWLRVGSEVWLSRTYLSGETFGWDAASRLERLGAFLARYHEAVSPLVTGPRPEAHGVVAPIRRALDGDLVGFLGDAGAVRLFQGLVARLPDHLSREAGWLPIHGDFTVDNVLVDPPSGRCCGVVDFDMAQLGPPVADLAWSVWRSARSHRDDLALSDDRLRQLVGGYREASSRTFSIRELLDWLVVRGLLWIAILAPAGRSPQIARRALDRAAWIEENRETLAAAVTGDA